jgi:addiction module HigA family antidote
VVRLAEDGAHRVKVVDYHQERNMAEMLDEIHPGEVLLEEFMKPMGITARQLAADIDVSPSRISELVNGRRPITADTALRLGLSGQKSGRLPWQAWVRGYCHIGSHGGLIGYK